jgi:hypothetical protein
MESSTSALSVASSQQDETATSSSDPSLEIDVSFTVRLSTINVSYELMWGVNRVIATQPIAQTHLCVL